MALTFPSNPTLNQVFSTGSLSWTWNGKSWNNGTSILATSNLVSSSVQFTNGNTTAFDTNSNITVGQITASFAKITNLTVQYITSSVVVITGSNKFGDASNDTQEFTGSVSMSGSLSIVGNITSNNVLSLASGTVGLPSLILSTDTTSGMYRIGANNIGISISAAKVLDISSTGLSVTGLITATGQYQFNGNRFLDSSSTELRIGDILNNYTTVGLYSQGAAAITLKAGNVGIGVTPSASSACTNIELPYGATLSARSNTVAPQFAMMSNAVGNWYAPTYKVNGYATQYTQQGFDGSHAWYRAASGTAGNAISFTQAMTLDASGNLGIGTTSAGKRLHIYSGEAAVGASQFNLEGYIGGYGAGLTFTSLLGGTSTLKEMARITADGEAAWNNTSTTQDAGLRLYTTSQGTTAERVRISAVGNVGIGTSSPSYATDIRIAASNALRVGSSNNAYGSLLSWDNTAGEARLWSLGSYALVLGTNGTERARIDSSGNLLVNTTTSGGWNSNSQLESVLSGNGSALSGYCTTSSGGGGQALILRVNATNYSLANFYYSTTSVGTITTNGTVTVYGGTSDYRRKSNVQDLTGSGTFIDALKPRTFDWDTGDKGVGFIAHEFAEVSPTSVCGEKDAVDADGKPIYQSMQASSAEVIANLVAELQSLRQRVAALEAK